jgi:selenoprotein W-related protein
LLRDFEKEIERFSLVPSDGGRFELSIDGHLVFSKLQSGRHARPDEVNELIRKYIEENQG